MGNDEPQHRRCFLEYRLRRIHARNRQADGAIRDSLGDADRGGSGAKADRVRSKESSRELGVG